MSYDPVNYRPYIAVAVTSLILGILVSLGAIALRSGELARRDQGNDHVWQARDVIDWYEQTTRSTDL